MAIQIALLSLLTQPLYGFNTFAHNASHWRSLSPFIPIANTSYGGIYLQPALSMEYKFVYHGKTTSDKYENVFRVGKGGKHTCPEAGTRYPSMWIHPTDDSFSISISHEARCWDSSIPYYPIQKHKLYQMRIQFNDTWRFVSVTDDSETFILKNSERQSRTPVSLLNTFMNVWISSEHSAAANVTLSDIKIKTWNPVPTTSTTSNPTSNTQHPTLDPSITPSSEPTFDPTVVPSSNPTVTPSIHPTALPTTRQIVVLPRTQPPTNTPLNDGMVPDTTLNPLYSTDSVVASDSKSDLPSWMGGNANNYIWLVIPCLIALLCLFCCVLIFVWKRSARFKSPTPSSTRNEEDVIFDKIYNQQIRLNIEQQRQHQYYDRHQDIVLPDEDTMSSGAAEELFIPQPRTRTCTSTATNKHPSSVDLNVSVQEYNVYGSQARKAMKSFSFNSSKKGKRGRYSPQLQTGDSEVELQHKVTVTISDPHGAKSKAMGRAHHAEGYKQYKQESDTEEEEEDMDVDIFHVIPPSSGVHSSGDSSARVVRNRLYVDHQAKNMTASYSNSRTSVIYEKPMTSANGDDDGEMEELYGKGKDPMSSPGCGGGDREPEGSHNYQYIEQWLKVCDEMDWPQYLDNFKRHKVNDYRLNRLSEKDWKQLIPPIGTRNEFKTLWIEYERQRPD